MTISASEKFGLKSKRKPNTQQKGQDQQKLLSSHILAELQSKAGFDGRKKVTLANSLQHRGQQGHHLGWHIKKEMKGTCKEHQAL